MIHPENWGQYFQGALWENQRLGLQSWKCGLNPHVGFFSYRLFRSARENGEHWSLTALVNLCLSACGRCWCLALLGGGYSSTLLTVAACEWSSLSYGYKTLSLILGLDVDSVVLGCCSVSWDYSIVPWAWNPEWPPLWRCAHLGRCLAPSICCRWHWHSTKVWYTLCLTWWKYGRD